MEYVHLVGAEQVQNAAITMRSAAETMQLAASSIEESLWRQRLFLEQWLADFRDALQKREQPPGGVGWQQGDGHEPEGVGS